VPDGPGCSVLLDSGRGRPRGLSGEIADGASSPRGACVVGPAGGAERRGAGEHCASRDEACRLCAGLTIAQEADESRGRCCLSSDAHCQLITAWADAILC